MIRLIYEGWLAIWPNLAASVIWTLPALAWHHRKIHARLDRISRASGAGNGRTGTTSPSTGQRGSRRAG